LRGPEIWRAATLLSVDADAPDPSGHAEAVVSTLALGAHTGIRPGGGDRRLLVG
jgi:hypothetical protein